MQDANFLTWTEEDFSAYGREPWVAKHRLHEDPMFTQAALISLLDDFPRDELQAFTMGHDVTRPSD